MWSDGVCVCVCVQVCTCGIILHYHWSPSCTKITSSNQPMPAIPCSHMQLGQHVSMHALHSCTCVGMSSMCTPDREVSLHTSELVLYIHFSM